MRKPWNTAVRVFQIVSLPILFAERRTRHERTQGETQLHVGGEATARGTAFADRFSDWIACMVAWGGENRMATYQKSEFCGVIRLR